MTDPELLEGVASENPGKAFEEIAARYTALVHSACLRVLGNPHEAEDAAQATFLVLLRKGPGLSRRTILSGWLHRTATHAALHLARGKARKAKREQEAAAMRQEAAAESAWEDLRPHLDEAMAALPKAQQDALTLRFFEGRSEKETAAAFGCAQGTVSARVSRAIEGLRSALKRRGVRAGSAVLAGWLSTRAVEAAPAHLPPSISNLMLGTAAPSGPAVVIAKGVLNTMLWSNLKLAAAGLAAALFVAASVPLVLHAMEAPPKGKPPRTADPKPSGPRAAGKDSPAEPPDGPTVKKPAADPKKALRPAVTAELKCGPEGRRPEEYVPGPPDHISVLVSQDGKRVFSARSSDGMIQAWDPTTGNEIWKSPGFIENATCKMALSPDGSLLATGRVFDGQGFPGATLLDAGTGAVQGAPLPKVLFQSFTPDGKELAVRGDFNGLTFFDVKSRKKTRQADLGLVQDSRWFADFDARGEKAAFASYGGELSVRTMKGEKLFDMRFDDPMFVGRLSPDGRLLGVLGWQSLQAKTGVLILDGTTGKEQGRIGEGIHPATFAFSPDGGRLAVGAANGTVGLFEVAGWKESLTLEGHRGAVDAVAFFPDGRRLVSGSAETSLLVWDLGAELDGAGPAEKRGEGRGRVPGGGEP